MNNFVYSTQVNLEGPWLVDRDALLHLGRDIETISGKFANANKEFIDNSLTQMLEGHSPEAREKYREQYLNDLNQRYAMKRRVTVSCSASKYIEDESIERLLSLPEMLHESPTELEIEIKTVHRSARIHLENRGIGGSKLSIRTSPETDELSRESFVELHQWATNNQAPLWQRFWSNNYGTMLMVWAFSLWIIASVALPSKSEHVERELREESIQVLKDGISNNEIPNAIELLLRNELKIPKIESPQQTPSWFNAYFYVGLASSVVLYFRPSLVIGMGRNELRIKRWRWWVKFIGITLPGFIFASIIWPYVSAIFGLH